MSKTELKQDDLQDKDYPLLIIKEELGEYLAFLSTEWVCCDVCHEKFRTRDLGEHVEGVHYNPPTRVWSKGPEAGWRKRIDRKARQDRVKGKAGRALECRCGLLCYDLTELVTHLESLASRTGHGLMWKRKERSNG